MFDRPIKPIMKPPDLTGPRGKAWRVDLAALRKQMAEPEPDATLAMWIAEAPWAHPLWHSYTIILIHLRPLGEQPTLFYVDGATHEIHVYAMDPDADREAIVLGRDARYFRSMLSPGNFAAQFIEKDDEAARVRVSGTVQHICDGALSPDTDYIRSWAGLYGDNMMKDRKHSELRQPFTRKG